MSELKYMGVSVSINDKHFVLVLDPAVDGAESCNHCALAGEPFCMAGRVSLISLCCMSENESNAFFKEVQSWSDLSKNP